MKKLLLSPTTLYEEASARYKEVSALCNQIEKRIGEYPEGKIRVVNNKGRMQYYCRTHQNKTGGNYIRKKEKDIIRKYIRKKYDEDVYKLLCKERDSLGSLLEKCKTNPTKIRNCFSECPQEMQEFIDPVDMSDDDYARIWLKKAYEGKEIGPDTPIYLTDKGERVRSKSELNIANMLLKYNIPYKYECPLKLSSGLTIYPDFVALNIRSRKEIYWEHRGMMEDSNYARDSVKRMKVLTKEGIILGKNLIISEESVSCPLGTDEIERMIKEYLN